MAITIVNRTFEMPVGPNLKHCTAQVDGLAAYVSGTGHVFRANDFGMTRIESVQCSGGISSTGTFLLNGIIYPPYINLNPDGGYATFTLIYIDLATGLQAANGDYSLDRFVLTVEGY